MFMMFDRLDKKDGDPPYFKANYSMFSFGLGGIGKRTEMASSSASELEQNASEDQSREDQSSEDQSSEEDLPVTDHRTRMTRRVGKRNGKLCMLCRDGKRFKKSNLEAHYEEVHPKQVFFLFSFMVNVDFVCLSDPHRLVELEQ